MTTLSREDIFALYENGGIEAVADAMVAHCESLTQRLNTVEAEVHVLRDQVSRNRSTPPSSDDTTTTIKEKSVTQNEYRLLAQLFRKEISEEDFLSLYNIKPEEAKEFVVNKLQLGYTLKDEEFIRYFILVGQTLKSFSKGMVPFLCLLLKEDWHDSHEVIVEILGYIGDESIIEPIYNAIQFSESEIYAWDDTYALARKCIDTLADFNTKEAIEKLNRVYMELISEIRVCTDAPRKTNVMNVVILYF